MSTISRKMLNDSIGKMNKDAYYSSKYTPNKPETKKEKEKLERKRIKKLESTKTKEQIKNILLTVERNKKYDEEIDIDLAKIFISDTNKTLTEKQVEEIAQKRAEIRRNTISEENRNILDNMVEIYPEEDAAKNSGLLMSRRDK